MTNQTAQTHIELTDENHLYRLPRQYDVVTFSRKTFIDGISTREVVRGFVSAVYDDAPTKDGNVYEVTLYVTSNPRPAMITDVEQLTVTHKHIDNYNAAKEADEKYGFLF